MTLKLRRAGNKPLHTEPRAARFCEINVVRRGPVNGDDYEVRGLASGWNPLLSVSGDYITGLFGNCVGGSAGSELVGVALWASGKDVD